MSHSRGGSGPCKAARPQHTGPVLLEMPSATAAAAAKTRSIYNTFSIRRRALILAVVSVSQFLNPLSSSVVLPSLQEIQHVFQASNTAAAAIVAVFYFPVGVSSLFWGPACDMWGRKITYLASTAVFAAATLGCIFPSSMQMLLAFRGLQGVALGAYRGAGIGTIADVYPPERRGLAIGILVLTTLVGPVIGPLLGGFLAQAYGWRAPFITLLIFSSGIIIPLVLLCVPETHQYKTMKRLVKANPAAAAEVREGTKILSQPPRFGSLLTPILLILDKDIVVHLLVALVGFASLISVEAELPGLLSSTPYNLSPGLIGVAMLPAGISGLIASPLGGHLFDKLAASQPHPMLRLTFNNILSMVGMPTGLLIFGWSAHYRTHLAAVFIGLFLTGASMSIYLPAFMGYLSCMKQNQVSTASSGQNALIFLASGTLVMAGSAITGSLGYGWYASIMAALHLACAVAAQVQIYRKRAVLKGLGQPVHQHGAAQSDMQVELEGSIVGTVNGNLAKVVSDK